MRRTGTIIAPGVRPRATRFFITAGAVTWASRRQHNVTLSTTEAELVALSAAAREAIWLRELLKSVGILQDEVTVLKSDSTGAISLAVNPAFHQRSKHIRIHDFYVREQVDRRTIKTEHVPGKENVADIFTKPLPRDKFERYRAELGIT